MPEESKVMRTSIVAVGGDVDPDPDFWDLLREGAKAEERREGSEERWVEGVGGGF